MQVESQWSGPLPSSESIDRFNQVADHGGDRIIAEWEAEAAHRRAFERRALTAEITERILGRIFAFVFAMGALGTAAWCAYLGHPGAASVIGGATIAAVVAALVYQGKK